MPFFSIVIASRNRLDDLSLAVNSILAQTFQDYEVIVVDDGYQTPLALDHLKLPRAELNRVRIVSLGRQCRGRGPGYARNVGVWASSGRYCAFLDDDDSWTLDSYLADAQCALEQANTTPDLYFANQEAFGHDGIGKKLWLYPAVDLLQADGAKQVNGAYTPTASELIRTGSFCHLNTTIVRRSFFDQIEGLDEYLAYEEDLDFYLRAIDNADSILFSPAIVARHNIPDHTLKKNASTSLSRVDKLNIRLFILNKNSFLTRHKSLENYCCEYYASTSKLIAEHYVSENKYSMAYRYALRALGARVSLKWFVYCCYLRGRSLLKGPERK